MQGNRILFFFCFYRLFPEILEFYSIHRYQSNEHGCVKAEISMRMKNQVQIHITKTRYLVEIT